jgi:hypothetical protein
MNERVIALLFALPFVPACEKGPEAPPTNEPTATSPEDLDDEPEPDQDDDPPNLS